MAPELAAWCCRGRRRWRSRRCCRRLVSTATMEPSPDTARLWLVPLTKPKPIGSQRGGEHHRRAVGRCARCREHGAATRRSCSAPACPTLPAAWRVASSTDNTLSAARFHDAAGLRWGPIVAAARLSIWRAAKRRSDMGHASPFQRGAELHLKCMNAAFHPLKPVPKVDGDTARSVDCTHSEGTPCARAAGPWRPLLATLCDLRIPSRKKGTCMSTPDRVVVDPSSPSSLRKRAPRLRAGALHAAVVLVSLAAAGVTLVGCAPDTSHAQGHGPGGGGPPPAAVSVLAMAASNIALNYEYVGQTAGSRDVEVRARVPGILLKRNFTEGGNVKRGQSLYSLDPAPFQAALNRADADVASADAKLAMSTRTLNRLKPLWEARAVSQREYDDAASAEQVARADLKGAQARRAEAALNLEYTKVEVAAVGRGRPLAGERRHAGGRPDHAADHADADRSGEGALRHRRHRPDEVAPGGGLGRAAVAAEPAVHGRGEAGRRQRVPAQGQAAVQRHARVGQHRHRGGRGRGAQPRRRAQARPVRARAPAPARRGPRR